MKQIATKATRVGGYDDAGNGDIDGDGVKRVAKPEWV